MASEPADFLSRWSRRKLAAAAAAAAPASVPAAPEPAAPPLPALESLDFDSDFGSFLRAKVDERLKRAALKKLFSDPRFNVMDGLDIYIGDYSIEDPIPEAMLAQLEHARITLFGPPREEEKAASEVAAAEGGEPPEETTSEQAGSEGEDVAAAA